MKLDDLKRLAELMQEETGDFLGVQDRFRTALSPERVLQMIRVIELAHTARRVGFNAIPIPTDFTTLGDRFDAARTELEAL